MVGLPWICLEGDRGPVPSANPFFRKEKGTQTYEKSSGHRPEVPRTPGGTSSALTEENGQKRAFCLGHRPGVPGTPEVSRDFMRFFSHVPFLLPFFLLELLCEGLVLAYDLLIL